MNKEDILYSYGDIMDTRILFFIIGFITTSFLFICLGAFRC